ncbi:hypothetical protein NDU88_001143 [Pleurodeles waltl]|uniref:Uncharacterized protein n=1 Tax=Pleurodeles waltl TaxID=8319 RepID=A0AAV7LAL8_PLEWA|nr:hypothetical protein NDU88_001143 [Pleurodeles waltl]
MVTAEKGSERVTRNISWFKKATFMEHSGDQEAEDQSFDWPTAESPEQERKGEPTSVAGPGCLRQPLLGDRSRSSNPEVGREVPVEGGVNKIKRSVGVFSLTCGSIANARCVRVFNCGTRCEASEAPSATVRREDIAKARTSDGEVPSPLYLQLVPGTVRRLTLLDSNQVRLDFVLQE